jgi:hypothetical protein
VIALGLANPISKWNKFKKKMETGIFTTENI